MTPEHDRRGDGGTAAVEARGLTRAFGSEKAVDGLDLSIARGELFGLVGPDGAGKSTFIRLLCGLLQPSGGTAAVLGFDLQREAAAVKARIGYLSQSFTLYGDLTIDENIEFFADLHGVPDYHARRQELLDFTRLTPFRGRLAQQLSGGMKKKLALACTLIHLPELILLDEPSTGVDPVSRGEFWNILSAIRDRGVTVILTTPYLDEAERCHRIGLMHHGRLLMTGTPDEVRARLPGAVYRIDAPSAERAYRVLKEQWPPDRLVSYADRVHVWTEAGEEEARACVARLDAEGAGPAAFARAEPSLEDVFVAMVTEEKGAPR